MKFSLFLMFVIDISSASFSLQTCHCFSCGSSVIDISVYHFLCKIFIVFHVDHLSLMYPVYHLLIQAGPLGYARIDIVDNSLTLGDGGARQVKFPKLN